MQLTYDIQPAIGLPGQIATGSDFREIVTGVIPEEGQAEIADIVFAGTWAPNDDVVSTVMGIPANTTNIVGATPLAARNEHLVSMQAVAGIQAIAVLTAVGNDTIRVASREIGQGTGRYYDLGVTAGEVTAGSGTAVATTTQQAIDAGAIEFGMGLAKDPTDARGKRVTVPSATAFVFGGVSVRSHAVPYTHGLQGEERIVPTQPINLMLKGSIYLVCEDGCEPGDPVYLRHTRNGANLPGHFRTDADTARADLIVGARWMTGAAAGGLARAFLG